MHESYMIQKTTVFFNIHPRDDICHIVLIIFSKHNNAKQHKIKQHKLPSTKFENKE